jgi:adenosylcobinamide-phosphate synthase
MNAMPMNAVPMNAVPVLAVIIDRVAGEPPARLHPVVWMGHYCTWAGQRAGRGSASTARRQFTAGGIAVAAGAVAAGLAAAALQRAVARLPRPIALAAEAVTLSTLLSARMLEREVRRVSLALDDHLDAGRRVVAGLVSRDVTSLDATQVREAALESLAENASDAIVAPLWWYAIAGLPGAAVYRFINTADAMWGYRTAAWEWRGKVAARVDDLANWWPARLTAVLLAPRVGISRIGRAAAATASPNAGWPMSALALRLGVRLRKPGVYTLNARGRSAVPGDVEPAIGAVRRATAVAAVAAALTAGRPRDMTSSSEAVGHMT